MDQQFRTYQQYSTNDKGERIIPATQRADGTWREEIKVRAGYVPQDEVELYVAPHVGQSRIRKENRVTPGMEYDEEGSTSVPKQKSKNQKKRERKKAREQQVEGSEQLSDQGSSQQQYTQVTSNKVNESVEDGRVALEGLQLGDRKQPKHADSADLSACSIPAASNNSTTDQSEVLRKQANKLRKKLRECENLRKKVEDGQLLSPEENKKLNQQEGWQEELGRLELLVQNC
eukprot:TRINITY_DN6424_c0_g1_i1.p1 TRINITY_DN6424_c0_g1~~TRINITY_DN6424_c0_g1_i1.p1  ORF type:complete len:231 (-),score=38.59 TRINITY_DN6424_c0_g1_i1:95-787(-)